MPWSQYIEVRLEKIQYVPGKQTRDLSPRAIGGALRYQPAPGILFKAAMTTESIRFAIMSAGVLWV